MTTRKGKQDRTPTEEELHLQSLKRHGRVIECDDPDAPLPPGVTHVIEKQQGSEKPRLVERRKSFF